jgi:hypothetical protein
MPPIISKYFRNSMAILLLYSTLLFCSYPHRLPGKEQAKHFSENEFLHQQCDGQ